MDSDTLKATRAYYNKLTRVLIIQRVGSCMIQSLGLSYGSGSSSRFSVPPLCGINVLERGKDLFSSLPGPNTAHAP
eukprot:scaffold696_cov417-Prasinococcus_capsulatus_cf.AAC.2